MSKTLIRAAMLVLALAIVVPAQARETGAWRLGEPIRDGYAIYRLDRGGWYRVPGSAIAVADGWVLSGRPTSGGYRIYRWNGYDWDRAPGGAVEIGGSYRRPWVINDRGQRFLWNGYDWVKDYARDFRSQRGSHDGREFGGRGYRDRYPGFDRRSRYRDY